MTAIEFSKFVDILSTALSQHQLLGFEIAGTPSCALALFIVTLPKGHLTPHSVIIFIENTYLNLLFAFYLMGFLKILFLFNLLPY